MTSFASRLVAWQRTHGRSGLPWQVNDPYRVWVSEIMLQQTQVATVLDYYPRFLARFPTVEALGGAPLDEVLALWSGLGYYSRARNLHKAAQRIVSEFGGEFPRGYEQILDLPGIGRSTAAAICAFSFGERRAILDGNVRRVLARWGGIAGHAGEKAVENRLWALADSLLPTASADMAAHTQGLMDLGSLVCTRGKPACMRCPLAADCVALREDRVASLPTPRPRKSQPTRDAVWLLAHDGLGRILLERRPESGIWGGLWSLPELSSSEAVGAAAEHHGFRIAEVEPALDEIEHVFTHFRLLALPLPVRVDGNDGLRDLRQGWFLPGEALTLGLPAPVRRLLESWRETS